MAKLNLRGGKDGSNNGWFDPATGFATFFLLGDDVEANPAADGEPNTHTVFIRMAGSDSTVRDLTIVGDDYKDNRAKALARTNQIMTAQQNAVYPVTSPLPPPAA